MYVVTEYQYQQLRNRYPGDEVVKEIGRQPYDTDNHKNPSIFGRKATNSVEDE